MDFMICGGVSPTGVSNHDRHPKRPAKSHKGRSRQAAVAVALAGLLTLPIACSSGGSIADSTTTSNRPATTLDRLPPRSTGALVKLATPLLADNEEIQRVYLDVSAGENKSLLSLYVRPKQTWTPDTYAERTATLAADVIPVLFTRYPGVAAIDLCLEEPSGATDDPAPPPVTRVFLTRGDAATISWPTFDLKALRRHAKGDRPDIQLQVTKDVAGSNAFRAAKAS